MTTDDQGPGALCHLLGSFAGHGLVLTMGFWATSRTLSLRPRNLFGSSSPTVLAGYCFRTSFFDHPVGGSLQSCRRVGQFRPRLLLLSIASSQKATRILEVAGQECVLGLFRLGLTRSPKRCCVGTVRSTCAERTRRIYHRHSPV